MNIIEILTEIIEHLGYAGIASSTCLEYACFPISSELLLPFIGYSVSKGKLSLAAAIIASTLGGILGCTLCYFIGRFGTKFIEKTICRHFKSIETGLNSAKKYFDRYGKQSVFIARVFPIARTYISIPAGMVGMNFLQFLFYSGVGALIWNTVLISAGFFLGEHWQDVGIFLGRNKTILCFIIIIVFTIIIISFKNIKKHN